MGPSRAGVYEIPDSEEEVFSSSPARVAEDSRADTSAASSHGIFPASSNGLRERQHEQASEEGSASEQNAMADDSDILHVASLITTNDQEKDLHAQHDQHVGLDVQTEKPRLAPDSTEDAPFNNARDTELSKINALPLHLPKVTMEFVNAKSAEQESKPIDTELACKHADSPCLAHAKDVDQGAENKPAIETAIAEKHNTTLHGDRQIPDGEHDASRTLAVSSKAEQEPAADPENTARPIDMPTQNPSFETVHSEAEAGFTNASNVGSQQDVHCQPEVTAADGGKGESPQVAKSIQDGLDPLTALESLPSQDESNANSHDVLEQYLEKHQKVENHSVSNEQQSNRPSQTESVFGSAERDSKSSTCPQETIPTEPTVSEDSDTNFAAKDTRTRPPKPIKPDLMPKLASARSSPKTTLSELKAQKAALLASLSALANIKELIAEDEVASISDEPSDADVMTAANKMVKNHIKLLHEYNEIKDVGQGLMGLIADQRGVRIVEVQDEFGISSTD